ncbi:hypothetical protein BOTNAR_0347g00060 [Botryotinia narcissicola]|uniref:Uncharacterized protein n=1 Tax=Botryotinia narcissicola TaxID=278944 RepID=A0A4Z1HRL1_9HELO|nr:hypothetical protein BOTNAR_0347g00060 [Botryotinia narcissicola]
MEEQIEKLTKDRDDFEARTHSNMNDLKRIEGERQVLAEELSKVRKQTHSPSEDTDEFLRFTSVWDNSLVDEESLDRFQDLRADISRWSRREIKDLSQLDDLQGRDRELFFEEAAIVILDESDKRELPKVLRKFSKALLYILGALLTHHLYATVFSDPFFFLGEETSQILNDIMSLGNTCHPYDPPNPEMSLQHNITSRGSMGPEGQPIFMVESPTILRYGLRQADDCIFEERWWHQVYGFQRATVWVRVPLPEELYGNEEAFTPMALASQPEQLKDLKPVTFPLRSNFSVEELGEGMRKRVDRVTLLDLVKPYLDDFAEQLRPVLEGLRGEIAQRIEERNEMEKQRDEFRSKYREALELIERLKSGM